MKLRVDTSYYDVNLHKIGVLQCESNQEQLNKVNFKTVFVSPMRRTLQTAIHMFKNHPQKKEIKFLVVPIIREVLETACDIALDIEDIMDKYGPNSEQCHGLEFDFSLMYMYGQPQLWQVYTLANFEKQRDILSQVAVDKRGISNYKEVLLQKLGQSYPRYETHQDLY